MNRREYYPRIFRSVHISHIPGLRITLTEGKFRQVRKMVEAVRHRCVRLIRESIEDLHTLGMKPGEVKEINEKEFFEKLKL